MTAAGMAASLDAVRLPVLAIAAGALPRLVDAIPVQHKRGAQRAGRDAARPRSFLGIVSERQWHVEVRQRVWNPGVVLAALIHANSKFVTKIGVDLRGVPHAIGVGRAAFFE